MEGEVHTSLESNKTIEKRNYKTRKLFRTYQAYHHRTTGLTGYQFPPAHVGDEDCPSRRRHSTIHYGDCDGCGYDASDHHPSFERRCA